MIVQFTASKEGLCHKTELQDGPAADPSAWSEGDLIDVQLLEVRTLPTMMSCMVKLDSRQA